MSRFQTVMPEMLKNQVKETLEENLATHIDASVVQPLERALLACREEAAASHERTVEEISRRGRHTDSTTSNMLQSFNGQTLQNLCSPI